MYKQERQKDVDKVEKILNDIHVGREEEIIIKKLMRGYSLEQDEAKHYYEQCTMGMVAD